MEQPFEFVPDGDRWIVRPVKSGPAPQSLNCYLDFSREWEAENACRVMARIYQLGKDAKLAEIRGALGF